MKFAEKKRNNKRKNNSSARTHWKTLKKKPAMGGSKKMVEKTRNSRMGTTNK